MIFDSLRKILDTSPKSNTKGLLGELSSAEFAILREFRNSDAHNVLCTVLNLRIAEIAERMLRCDRDSELIELRGVVIGLRESLAIVTDLIRSKEFEANAQRQQQRQRQLDRPTALVAEHRFGPFGGSAPTGTFNPSKS